jgi:uncharacterized membrane protein YczE
MSSQSRIDRPLLRGTTLAGGLVLFGVSVALLVASRLGPDPWDVLHQGIARHFGIRLGWVVLGASVVVLLLWIPLRQRPGVGTIADALVVGPVVNLVQPLLPVADGPLGRSGYLVLGVLVNALATGLYVGAGLGPGPRDGLMTGLAGRGHSIRLVRTGIEVTVFLIGWLLGGTVGVGTAVYAVAIGPLVHLTLRRLRIPPRTRTTDTETEESPCPR